MRLLSLYLALSFGAAMPAISEPEVFGVVGVASNDTLNIRAAPDAASADIGDLSHDATGVEVAFTDPSGRWGNIVWQEGNGWVAMRFLEAAAWPTVGASGLPTGLTCSGTEPFWTVKLSDSSGIYSDLAGGLHAMELQGSRIAEGRPRFPVQVGLAGASANATLLVRPLSCSDGMSDRTYPWSVDMVLNTADGGRYLVGCCQLPLDAGTQ